jgi:carbamoyltransferase
MPWLRRFFVAGSSSDESNSIGAALCAAAEKGVPLAKAVTTLYLGAEAEPDQGLLDRARRDGQVVVMHPTAAQLAEALKAGVVIGRCIGRMEFGQRSLGNRSILADPVNPDVVPRINAMIKSRDFWMPFAPVILDTFVDEYLVNPNRVDSPQMTIAYQTTPEGFRALRAACHLADRTARAQILGREQNPPLYELLEEFQRLTGRGGVLNTSFNLHGYPIVRTTVDAYEVFHATQLDALLIPDALLLKPACLQNPAIATLFTTTKNGHHAE